MRSRQRLQSSPFPALFLYCGSTTCLCCREVSPGSPEALPRTSCEPICVNLGKSEDMLLSAPPSAASTILSVAFPLRTRFPLYTPGNVEERKLWRTGSLSKGIEVFELIITPRSPFSIVPEIFLRLLLSPLDRLGKPSHHRPTCWLVLVSPSRRAQYVSRLLVEE